MNNEAAAVVAHSSSSSSIALLQQRFRELQRVKEMREERELLKLLSLSHPYKKQLTLLGHLPAPVAVGTFFWHPELTNMATRITPQTSLSPSLCSMSQQPESSAVEAPPLINLWPDPTDTIDINAASDHSATSLVTIHDHDDDDSDSYSDIDTSLHL